MSQNDSEENIRAEMHKLVREVNLETVTTKVFIKTLSTRMGINLKHKKQFIKTTLPQILDAMDDDDEVVDVVKEEASVKGKKGKGKKKSRDEGEKKSSRGGSNNPFNASKLLSEPLANLLGHKALPRPQVVKLMWVYIKKHNLQSPSNGQVIILDATLKAIFNVEQFTMFKMAKHLSAHIDPFKPYVEEVETEETIAKKLKKKRKLKEKNANKPKKKRQMPPYKLSEELSKVVKARFLSRPDVVKHLWVYIRENNLQNPQDKREVICDDAFKLIMGGEEKVTIFSMSKYLSPHFLEKVDKSKITPKEEGDDEGEV